MFGTRPSGTVPLQCWVPSGWKAIVDAFDMQQFQELALTPGEGVVGAALVIPDGWVILHLKFHSVPSRCSQIGIGKLNMDRLLEE